MRVVLLLSLSLAVFAAYGPINRVLSEQSTSDRLSPKTAVNWVPDFDAGETITLTPSTKYQSILGFGGAFTEAATSTISKLTSALQNQILEAYYGSTGHKYTVGRVHMNSCDFSLASYNFDNVSKDYSLSQFDTKVTHDTDTMIPFISKAVNTVKSRGAELKLFLSPWSPPGWMKNNNNMVGSSNPGLIQDPNVFNAWALYFQKFMDGYKSYGIDYWGLTMQNEPEYGPTSYEGCIYNPQQEGSFLKTYLGPLLKRSYPNITIMIFDHNKGDAPNWADGIFGDAEASQYTQGIAVHWYDGDHFDNLNAIHNKYPNKFIMGTEACNCPTQVDNWGFGENYGHDIMGDLNAWTVGWTDWNIVLNTQGGPTHNNGNCDAPIIANTNSQSIHFQPSYYYMGHFSRYLPPGSVRIGKSDTGNHESTAFQDPQGNVVFISLNRGGSDVQFKLRMADTNQTALIDSPPHSIQTLYFRAQ